MQQLPVKLYESIIDIVQGEATMLFVSLIYTLATEEAERIGVDHVVRTSTHENGGKSAGTLGKTIFDFSKRLSLQLTTKTCDFQLPNI